MKNKVLILIDYQNDFIFGALGSKQAQEIMSRIEEKIKNWEEPIFYTMDTHENGSAEEKVFPKHCIVHTEGWLIPPCIMNLLEEKEAEEVHKDSFGYNYWERLLEEYDEIHIFGLTTDICVLNNALIIRSLFPDRRIVVDAACCAGTSPEHHQMALELLKTNCVEVENE